MSASSQPTYGPIFFPVANVIAAYKQPWTEVVALHKKITGSLNIYGYLTLVASSFRGAMFAYLAMYWMAKYPGFGQAKSSEFGEQYVCMDRDYY